MTPQTTPLVSSHPQLSIDCLCSYDENRICLFWSRESNNPNTRHVGPCTYRTAIFQSMFIFPPDGYISHPLSHLHRSLSMWLGSTQAVWVLQCSGFSIMPCATSEVHEYNLNNLKNLLIKLHSNLIFKQFRAYYFHYVLQYHHKYEHSGFLYFLCYYFLCAMTC